MISITRSLPPPHQIDNTLRNLVENDYTHDSVIEALLLMQNYKCCYCEKDLTTLGKTALWVDHFISRTDNSFKDAHGRTNWNLANNWTNLLYACSTCNRSKGTIKPLTISGRRNLLDPSDPLINPELHIDFVIKGFLIVYKEKSRSRLGRNTINNLKLKERHDVYKLLRIKMIEIDAIFAEMVNAYVDGNLLMANSKINELQRASSAHNSHAAFTRKYILQKQNDYNLNLHLINNNYGKQLQPLALALATGSQVLP